MSDGRRHADRLDLTGEDLDRAAALVKVLDSRTRLEILLLLGEEEMVVHQLVAELGKSQPLISQHLRVLRAAGLVTSARKGREVLYALAQPGIIAIIAELAAIADPLLTTPEPVRD
ncbi:ArsR/SmtB family transcription factor [Corynebacterium mucifaciens]|uniref:DNA-binding transcriptional ArsR family regulator n=1 Tax=Corynebacterium mucifaciens TaxID=57171 RepID=A0A7X6REN7_9CORY|nr:metalloregulator ArsR/SmtB family transcription factor [Corynebacterium mucifaciens]NKY69002.1 helix-turn-helix transcriptional regulator [Corynebacterium mucifaciens]